MAPAARYSRPNSLSDTVVGMKPYFYDDPDPDILAGWLRSQRARVEAYLESEGVQHRGVSADPDWYIAPCLAIWSVKSNANPASVGWWAISGAVPTDHISSAEIHTARDALRQISSRWSDVAAKMVQGEADLGAQRVVTDQQKQLGQLILVRARVVSLIPCA